MIRIGTPSPIVSIAALRCACGSADIACIDPGAEPEIAPGGIVVARGRCIVGLCLRCWPMARGYQQELFAAEKTLAAKETINVHG